MDEFLLKFDALNSQLKGLGVEIEPLRLIHIILKKCLPKPFQQFITNVHAQLALPSLAKEVFGFLLRQEAVKLLQFGYFKSNDNAFVAKQTKSKDTCNFCGKQGHVESKCFKKSSCNFCGKKSHVEAKCF